VINRTVVNGGNLFTDGLPVSEYLGLRHSPPALCPIGKIDDRIKTAIKCMIQNGSWVAPDCDRIDFLVEERALWPDFSRSVSMKSCSYSPYISDHGSRF
jgi:hypothetical protein